MYNCVVRSMSKDSLLAFVDYKFLINSDINEVYVLTDWKKLSDLGGLLARNLKARLIYNVAYINILPNKKISRFPKNVIKIEMLDLKDKEFYLSIDGNDTVKSIGKILVTHPKKIFKHKSKETCFHYIKQKRLELEGKIYPCSDSVIFNDFNRDITSWISCFDSLSSFKVKTDKKIRLKKNIQKISRSSNYTQKQITLKVFYLDIEVKNDDSCRVTFDNVLDSPTT